jgi:hypothetical protein
MQQVPRIIQPAEKSLYEALRPWGNINEYNL